MRLVLAALCCFAAGCEDAAAPFDLDFPTHLSEAGLYRDLSTRQLVPGAIAFAPDHILWADGAEKARWLVLPQGGVIDGSDPDHWTFPIGTRFFKEFSLDGRPLETRLIVHVANSGDYAKDFLAGAYLWDDDERDATIVPDGAENVRGTMHDVPSRDSCWRCHIGEPGHILGFQALQLAGSGDTSPARLVERGLLTHAPSAPIGLVGDPGAIAAQGWLHANCGHCHNPNGNAWSQTPMVLRLAVDEHDPMRSQLFETTVGVPLNYFHSTTYTQRIVPGDPAASGLVYRDRVRGTLDQMPPLATELPDTDGTALVEAWIRTLR